MTRTGLIQKLSLLLSGNGVAQILPILFLPILTRIYGPEQFGALALIVGVSTIIASVSSGRYEVSTVLAKLESHAKLIFTLSSLLNYLGAGLFLSLLLLLHFFETYAIVSRLFQLYLVVIVVIGIGQYNAFNYLMTKLENYKYIAMANIVRVTIMLGTQIAGGYIWADKGLIIGFTLGYIFQYMFIVSVTAQHFKDPTLSWKRLKVLMRKYSRFPKLSMPGVFMNTTSMNLPLIFIEKYFDAKSLGFYSIVQKILGTPVNVIGMAIGQIYYREAHKEKLNSGRAILSFRFALKNLIIVGLIIFCAIWLSIERVVGVLLGPGWDSVAGFVEILIPMYLVRFIAVSLSNTTNLFERQDIALKWQIGLLAMGIVNICICVYMTLDFSQFLTLMSWSLLMYYLYLLYIVYFLSRGQK